MLGAGRAGIGLARALRASGLEVVGVHGRRDPGGADGVSVGALPPALADATVVLVTVRDAQLDAALGELGAGPIGRGAAVLHASGSADPPALADLRSAGHPCGTFHPLVPLSDPWRAQTLLDGAWVGVDGDPRAQGAARTLAERLGARVLAIPAGEKARYHAAAVLASNYPAVLLALAERLLLAAGVPADAARDALGPLFFAAIDNLRRRRGPESLTGPIVRGDVPTVRLHLNALAGDPLTLDAYRALARAALPLAAAAGTDATRLAEIEALLREPAP